ncbi:Zinc finger CCCH domain-containing protein 38 [Platanthera guangdongensis]|uniref:Zinc finger CCCH domain-containing protein 38 n=1 Tax=Platanthera guangdongensis TaxID=2320717 RepID=A0ABR2LIA3_9ASPA
MVCRKRNRSKTRSRSPPNDSRSKSWSRSRSPSHAYRQSSERWTDTGRMRGMMPFCRDFASGRCRRDDCRFLHEGGGGLRQIGRQYDVGSTDGRGSRSDRVNYSREKLSRRHDDPYKDGRDNSESHRGNDNNESPRGYRVPNRCFDFTKGRCQRGASCRYAHHGASSDGGWNARDESKVRSHDRSWSGSGSGNRTQEWQPVYKVPCKFFLENNCRNGERCKFSHQVRPADIPVASSVDSELHDQTAHFAPPLPFNGQMQQIMPSHPQNSHNQFPVLLPMPNSNYFNTSLLNQPSRPLHYELNLQNPDSQVQVQQNLLMQSQNESSYNLNGRIQQNVPPIHIVQNQPDFNTVVPIQQNIHNAQNLGIPIQQNVPPIHKAQNQTDFNIGIPIQQNVPPIQQNVPPIQQNVPPIQQNVHPIQKNVHPIQQNVHQIHKVQNQTDFNLIPIQQNVPPIHKAQNQTDFNLGILIQQNVSPIHKAQNQTDFNLGVPIQQNVPPIHNTHNQPDFNPRVPVQHNVPPTHNVQNQSNFNVGVPNQQNLASDAGHSHQDVASPSHISDAKILMEKNQTSVQQHMALQVADSLEVKPSQTNSDIPITNKVVTSEQAAKIIDLSASLAQFFGTAALNSQSTAGMTPQPFLNPDSLSAFAATAAPLPTEVDSSQANLSRPIPLEEKPRIQQVVSSHEREAKKLEAPQINKDQIVQLPSDDEEGKKNGDNRKIKEGKDVKMFKCALIEFVKDMLKPKWKEGQLSKEAHKTIVKKVVDKVCGSLQGPNVPQTQEKIDIYLLSSKPKLSKLVQVRLHGKICEELRQEVRMRLLFWSCTGRATVRLHLATPASHGLQHPTATTGDCGLAGHRPAGVDRVRAGFPAGVRADVQSRLI